jgi:hypothetical protein
MSLALTIIAVLLGGLGHLLLLGLCVFGMANSSPQQMTQIKLWMLAVAIVALVVGAAGVLLYRLGHPAWGIVLNLASPPVMLGIMLKATTP